MKTFVPLHIRRITLLGILLALFSFSVQAQPQASLDYPNAEQDLATAKATLEAYEAGNWEALRTHLKDSARIYGLGNYDSLNVDQTIAYWAKGRPNGQSLLADDGTWMSVSIPEGPRAGNWIFHWGTNTITYENGDQVTFPFHIALKMEDQKVAESHFYYDNMKIIRAKGYALSPPLEELDDDGLEPMAEQN